MNHDSRWPQPAGPPGHEILWRIRLPDHIHSGHLAPRSPRSPLATEAGTSASVAGRCPRSWDSWPSTADRSLSRPCSSWNQKGADVFETRLPQEVAGFGAAAAHLAMGNNLDVG